jgi:hypothetical protein
MGNLEEVVAGTEAQFRKAMLSSALAGALPSMDVPFAGPASKAERALRTQFLERLKPTFEQIFQQRFEKKWATLYFETTWTYITKSFRSGTSARVAAAAPRDKKARAGHRKDVEKAGQSTIESQVTDLFTHLYGSAFTAPILRARFIVSVERRAGEQ